MPTSQKTNKKIKKLSEIHVIFQVFCFVFCVHTYFMVLENFSIPSVFRELLMFSLLAALFCVNAVLSN